MDVIVFLCVSLGSSTVQLHDSLGSRRACSCSEAGLIVKMAARFEECTTKERCSVMRFSWARKLNAKDTKKEIMIIIFWEMIIIIVTAVETSNLT
jgi:hypothetical protein